MEHEPGDEYIRRIAKYIRDNDRKLGAAGIRRQRKASSTPSIFNPLGWMGLAHNAPEDPLILSFDTHHLFYLLMRLEAEGIDVGSLDVEMDNPSRPLSYIHLDMGHDKSETLSISSLRSSFSVVSKLSLGSGWWSAPDTRQLDAELRFIFSSFTMIPALSLHSPGPKMIAELAQDPPGDSAIPMDSFRNLRSLECQDVDPRALLGWDRMSESLRSLTIKRSGLDDPATLFIDAVLDDQLRRSGDASRQRTRKLARNASRAFHVSLLPETVEEEAEDSPAGDEESPTSYVLAKKLSPLKWAFLKHLSLADNALTFFPTSILSSLTSLMHLDLSSNLLVSIPSLSALFNLISLNLSDNMVDSVLGVYTKLGQVLALNLSRNRLDSLCGLERLMALERVDLRNNLVEESAEVGRLAILPNIQELWIQGNPFAEIEEQWRIRCFEYFWKEGKNISLDGALPGYYERNHRRSVPPEQMYSSRPPPAAYSPPVVAQDAPQHSLAAIGARSPLLSPPQSASSSSAPSPNIQPAVAKAKRRRNKRLVALDNASGDVEYRASDDGGSPGRSSPHSRVATGARSRSPQKAKQSDLATPLPLVAANVMPEPASMVISTNMTASSPSEEQPIRRSRHSRYHTELGPPSPPADIASSPPSMTTLSRTRRSGTLNSPSAKRRARVSASVFEPATADGGDKEGAVGTPMKDSDAFRARIEALRAEMGDNWLQVLSQSQFRPSVSPKQ